MLFVFSTVRLIGLEKEREKKQGPFVERRFSTPWRRIGRRAISWSPWLSVAIYLSSLTLCEKVSTIGKSEEYVADGAANFVVQTVLKRLSRELESSSSEDGKHVQSLAGHY